MPADAPTKVCQICKQDCSTKPRTKDATGKYFCNACIDQRNAEQAMLSGADPRPASKAAPAPVAQTYEIEEPEVPTGFWEEPAAPTAAKSNAGTQACPKCGAAMFSNAAVCISCGFNTQTGKVMRTTAIAAPSGGAAIASNAGAVAAVASKGMLVFMLWIVGGGVAGAIGLGFWLYILFKANAEIGILAWGVGILVGVGVRLTGASRLNAISGLVAAGIAFFCVAGWKIALYLLLTNSAPSPSAAAAAIEADIHGPNGDAIAMDYYVVDVADDMASKGKKITWPDGSANRPSDPDELLGLDNYDEEVQKETKARWEKFATAEKDAKKTAIINRVKNEAIQSAAASKATARGIFDAKSIAFMVLWTFLACGSAFKLGSGGSLGDDD